MNTCRSVLMTAASMLAVAVVTLGAAPTVPKFIAIAVETPSPAPEVRITSIDGSGWITWTNSYVASGQWYVRCGPSLPSLKGEGTGGPAATVASGEITSQVHRVWVDVAETNDYFVISGILKWSSAPVPNHLVTVRDNHYGQAILMQTKTSSDGRFAFAQVPRRLIYTVMAEQTIVYASEHANLERDDLAKATNIVLQITKPSPPITPLPGASYDQLLEVGFIRWAPVAGVSYWDCHYGYGGGFNWEDPGHFTSDESLTVINFEEMELFGWDHLWWFGYDENDILVAQGYTWWQ